MSNIHIYASFTSSVVVGPDLDQETEGPAQGTEVEEAEEAEEAVTRNADPERESAPDGSEPQAMTFVVFVICGFISSQMYCRTNSRYQNIKLE